MRKKWLTTMAIGLALAIGMVAGTGLTMHAGADDVELEAGWRFSDGHWNYWDPDDRTWYYTDGSHWYFYGDDAWKVYTFDKKFAKKAYRKGYVVPPAGAKIVVPRHGIIVD